MSVPRFCSAFLIGGNLEQMFEQFKFSRLVSEWILHTAGGYSKDLLIISWQSWYQLVFRQKAPAGVPPQPIFGSVSYSGISLMLFFILSVHSGNSTSSWNSSDFIRWFTKNGAFPSLNYQHLGAQNQLQIGDLPGKRDSKHPKIDVQDGDFGKRKMETTEVFPS